MNKADILIRLGIQPVNSGVSVGPRAIEPTGDEIESISPIDGGSLARIRTASAQDYETVIEAATSAFRTWRSVPAPRRGEIIRQFGEELRAHKDALGALVTLETGKILPEGLGEVQEMIDICDFAVGQSRMLYGVSMHSERPGHRMYEQWHPLGPVGIISAFNFPVAVWAWNSTLAAICGDTCIWKPSPWAPLCAVATTTIANRVLEKNGLAGIFNLLIGDVDVIGEPFLNDKRIPLYSFTGSTRVGKQVAAKVASRFARGIYECGGNNAVILCADADQDLALRAVTFAAVGTAGQRCTTLRRLFIEKGAFGPFVDRLVKTYDGLTPRIGNPLEPGTLIGPLIGQHAVAGYLAALETIRKQGGEVLCGGAALQGEKYPGGCYVLPTIVKVKDPLAMPIMCEEVFAPILYVSEFDTIDRAIEWQNGVPQGLSSAMFTGSMYSAERFLSPAGSDCGIANINIGTSGAEIGGAFGGEKDTGGGRESGSDSWKQYMRRQTCTINYTKDLPLAQGIRFE
ncbi:MAG: aldehyde dehydrogenase family protein [Planctomycetota bacterium]